MRGGRRPGAGRKSDKQIQVIRDLFDQTFSAEDWRGLARGLMKAGQKGNLRAAELLLRYRFGDARETPKSSEYEQMLKEAIESVWADWEKEAKQP